MGSKFSKAANKEDKKESQEVENFDLHHADLHTEVFGEEVEDDWTSGLAGQRAAPPKPKAEFDAPFSEEPVKTKKKFRLWN